MESLKSEELIAGMIRMLQILIFVELQLTRYRPAAKLLEDTIRGILKLTHSSTFARARAYKNEREI